MSGAGKADPTTSGDRAGADVAALAEQNRRKDAFLLAVAHDLRASLSAIAGSVDVLRAERPAETMRAGDVMLDAIDEAVRHAETVIANLFDAERLEHGVAELVRRPTRLRELVERSAEASGVADRVDLEVDDATVALDAGLTERILANLLSNAVRHTPPDTWVCVCARDEGDHVLLHVDDAGPGIPEARRQEVFEAFRHGTGVGMGVGLHLVREFARFHGGDAWIEERSGGGASVRVRLPTS